MKAKIIWNDTDEEKVRQAEELGIGKPDPIFSKGAIWFDLSFIHVAYLNRKKEIVMYMPSGPWVIEYDKEVWTKIQIHLNDSNESG